MNGICNRIAATGAYRPRWRQLGADSCQDCHGWQDFPIRAARKALPLLCARGFAASGVRRVADFENAGDRCAGEGGAVVAVGPDARPE